MNDILISVIIPVYNVEDYIDDCMQSLIPQIDDNIEVLIINDGSTDSSPIICRQYEKKYKNIKLINQSNAGLSAARNTGINNAKGTYIMFLDSDDYLEDGAISKISKLLKDNTDIIVGKALTLDDTTGLKKISNIEYLSMYNTQPDKWLFEMDKKSEFWFAAWLVIIRREFLLENALYFKEGIYHEDELWVPTVFCRAKTMQILDFSFYGYRINRKGSIVNSVNTKKEFDKIKIIDEFNQMKFKSSVSRHLIKARCAALLYGIIRNLAFIENEEERRQLIDLVSSRLFNLQYLKYWGVYISCKLLGVEKAIKLFAAK